MAFSLLSLITSNAFMYYFAKTEGWSFPTILLVYWLQSVIIGVFQVLRMMRVKQPEFASPKNITFSVNGRDVGSLHGQVGKWFLTSFFIIHYGMFHFVYLIFILVFGFSGMLGGSFGDIGTIRLFGLNINGVFITTLIFFINHLVSFQVNREELHGKVNMAGMMAVPYARIIPMHLTICIGAAMQFPLELFMGLKTIADVVMHMYEHKKNLAPRT